LGIQLRFAYIGSFGVRAAFRTLKAIEKQADPMVQQITVARDAANSCQRKYRSVDMGWG